MPNRRDMPRGAFETGPIPRRADDLPPSERRERLDKLTERPTMTPPRLDDPESGPQEVAREANEWRDWRRFVLSELKYLRMAIEKNDEKSDEKSDGLRELANDVQVKIAVIETKMWVIGCVAGLVSTSIMSPLIVFFLIKVFGGHH